MYACSISMCQDALYIACMCMYRNMRTKHRDRQTDRHIHIHVFTFSASAIRDYLTATMNSYIHTCVYICMCLPLWPMWFRIVRQPTCLHTYMHTYTCFYPLGHCDSGLFHSTIHAYMYIYTRTYIHVFTFSVSVIQDYSTSPYIHTYIHTCIYIYACFFTFLANVIQDFLKATM